MGKGKGKGKEVHLLPLQCQVKTINISDIIITIIAFTLVMFYQNCCSIIFESNLSFKASGNQGSRSSSSS